MLFTHKNRKSCYLMSAPFSVFEDLAVLFLNPKEELLRVKGSQKTKSSETSKSATWCVSFSLRARLSALFLVCSQFGYNSLPSEYISQLLSSSSSKEDHIETQPPPARAYT